MPWRVSLNPELPVVETLYSGLLNPAELSDAVRATVSALLEHGLTRVLSDCTELEGGHSITDLYFLADAVLASGLSQVMKEAVLMPSRHDPAVNAQFWETLCVNRFFSVRLFKERVAAIEWLLQDSESQ